MLFSEFLILPQGNNLLSLLNYSLPHPRSLILFQYQLHISTAHDKTSQQVFSYFFDSPTTLTTNLTLSKKKFVFLTFPLEVVVVVVAVDMAVALIVEGEKQAGVHNIFVSRQLSVPAVSLLQKKLACILSSITVNQCIKCSKPWKFANFSSAPKSGVVDIYITRKYFSFQTKIMKILSMCYNFTWNCEYFTITGKM